MFEPAGEIEVEEEIDSGDELKVPLSPPKKKSRKDVSKWKKSVSLDKSFPPSRSNVTENILVLDGSTPNQTWETIFSISMLNHIVLHTNLYAQRDKNSPNFSVSGGDVRKFLGIILLSGYQSLPQEQHYWSTQPDLGVGLLPVYNTMSRNRYFAMKKFIHFADNQNLKEGDKMSTISPLYQMLNNNLVQLGIFHELLSVDESMVPYFGRHSAKIFIRGKPIRFGYKIWGLCGNDGYPYHLKIYQGKEPTATAQQETLGKIVINTMVGIITENSDALNHELYFDNFFSSYELMCELAEKDVRATGTIRENRTGGAKQKLIGSKELQKKDQGYFDYCTDGKVFVAKWHYNSIVTTASNWETHSPLHKVNRRVKGGKKRLHSHILSIHTIKVWVV